jgi:hypothetical protein
MVEEEGLFKKRLIEKVESPQIGRVWISDVKQIVDEAKTAFPLVHFEFQEPRQWNFIQYQHHYDSLAHQVLELIGWYQKWFGRESSLESEKSA